MRRIARTVADVLIVTAVLLAIEAGLTLTWQEPVTAILAARGEQDLARQLQALDEKAAAATPGWSMESDASSSSSLNPKIKKVERHSQIGHALGRLEIKELGLKSPYVQGADLSSLESAPGHYIDTDLPGEGGTVGIAGHRTTYGAPFRDIDDLRAGDEIAIEMPYGDFTYAVKRTRIVEPEAVKVLRGRGSERLVLTACHPPFSAAQRIVAFAELVADPATEEISVSFGAETSTARS